jgi:hypothetical protein
MAPALWHNLPQEVLQTHLSSGRWSDALIDCNQAFNVASKDVVLAVQ